MLENITFFPKGDLGHSQDMKSPGANEVWIHSPEVEGFLKAELFCLIHSPKTSECKYPNSLRKWACRQREYFLILHMGDVVRDCLAASKSHLKENFWVLYSTKYSLVPHEKWWNIQSIRGADSCIRLARITNGLVLLKWHNLMCLMKTSLT